MVGALITALILGVTGTQNPSVCTQANCIVGLSVTLCVALGEHV